ncbi:putative tRANSPOSASE [Mycobacterium xenopi 4042]|uniref:Putative tRANSPOSASE n=1 Tax=Mycobacterium xenopi 4042 TaxID=1299334 RepID=X8A7P8_MYCXE|nr:putative tRANSPOSASE [Mycobacterium xenopi 4042]
MAWVKPNTTAVCIPRPANRRWIAGGRLDRLGRTPAMPTADELTEAFLWSEYRVVTKTATVSLHANTYQVDPALVGARWSWCSHPSTWKPWRSATGTRATGKPCRTPSPPHPPQGQTGDPSARAAAATGIDYLALTAAPTTSSCAVMNASAITPSTARTTRSRSAIHRRSSAHRR